MSSTHTLLAPSRADSPKPVSPQRYFASIASDEATVRACQRLRYRVFAGEIGAASDGMTDEADVDTFDPLCDHLAVEDGPSGDVVGTYRLLPPGRTNRLYSDDEFDLTALAHLRPSLVEAGRSCVAAEHRGSGSVINLMWATVLRYVLLAGHRYLAGCASVPLADGGRAASATSQVVEARHLAPPELRVRPHHPWSMPPVERPHVSDLPPLLRGYLRLGAWICGPPAHDPDFGVADFFVLLPTSRINARYLRYFLGAAQ